MADKIVEMVLAAFVQEGVSRTVSWVLSNREEMENQGRLMERLERARDDLELAFERSKMMPMANVPLQRGMFKIKQYFKECHDVLSKHKGLRVPQDQEEEMVSRSSSLRRKIMHAVVPSFIIPNQDMLSSSGVKRFEWLAKEADKFVRDVETGCSLAHYRFLNPLIRHLLEGKSLFYRMVKGSKTCSFSIRTALVEEYGRVARLDFQYRDRKAPLKSFELILALRLYESTDIVGVTAKCLQSLGPQCKYLAEVATGELTQVPTHDVSYFDDCCCCMWDNVVALTTGWSPEPFCCIGNGLNKPSANNIISSELTGRFPQQVLFASFDCDFSAPDYCSQSSTDDEARINTVKAWPPLKMEVAFAPHLPALPESPESLCAADCILSADRYLCRQYPKGRSLHQTEEAIQTEAIDCFIRQPELTEYIMVWHSAHGLANFTVSKPVTKSRRGSKRSR